MGLQSTLLVFSEAEVAADPGVVEGQTLKHLVGGRERASERINVRLASFKPGTHEKLHWHLVEAFYYVISGRAVMKDIEGQSREIGPGSVVYAPPGIAAAHSWEIQETLQLISVRATTDLEKTIQFDIDPATKESSIDLDRLARREGVSFKKSLY